MKMISLVRVGLNETYSGVRVGKYLSDMFAITNGFKEDALSPLVFNYALEHAIRRVQVNQRDLKLDGTHQPVVYVDDVNILGGRVHTIKKNTKALVVASKKIGLQVNADKTKHMTMSRDQSAGRSYNTRIDNRSFETAKQLKY